MTHHRRRSVSTAIAAITAITAAMLLSSCGSSAPEPRSITLTLVRHAESAGNASGVIDTSVPGPNLTQQGRDQAIDLADQIARNDYDGIYASTMVRTQETAAPLSKDLGETVEVLPGLQEISAGAWEGKPVSQIASTYFVAPMAWLQGDRESRIPDSIDGDQFNDEFTGAVQDIYNSGDTKPVAFSHGAAIMVWTLMNVRNPQLNLLTDHPLPNTGRVVITGDPARGWTLIDWDGIAGS